MVASFEILPLVPLVPKTGVPPPRNPVVCGKWSRPLGFVEEKRETENLLSKSISISMEKRETENLAIVVLLVGALGWTFAGGAVGV